jgi:amino acid transporter
MVLVAALDFVLAVTGFVAENGLITMILAGSCFWIASYVLTHLNVLVLRRRYPGALRERRLMLGGAPQVLGIAGCVYMIWNISGDPADRALIYRLFATLFAVMAVAAGAWVVGVMKVKPFEPAYIGRMNIRQKGDAAA